MIQINDLEDIPQPIRTVIYDILGRTQLTIRKVSGGVVHHVYSISNRQTILYIKIRSSECSELPGILINANDIQYEAHAMSELSALHPNIFPTLLVFNADYHMLLMTDVMSGSTRLDYALNRQIVTIQQALFLGRTLADVHVSLGSLRGKVREVDDDKYYRDNLFYRLGYHNHHRLNDVVNHLKCLERQHILSDPSPKNIGITLNNQITMCDLEGVHCGNRLFDFAFLLGHLILHNLTHSANVQRLVNAYIEGYLDQSYADINDLYLPYLILGSVLCRLRNPVIPYSLPISDAQRTHKTHLAFELLDKETLNIQQIMVALCN